MNTRVLIPILVGTLTVGLTGLAAGVEMPHLRPIADYAELWTRSAFTVAPVKISEEEPADGEKPPPPSRTRPSSLDENPTPKTDPPATPAPDQAKTKAVPPKTSPQKAESALENFSNREALRNGLKVKRRKLLPTITEPGAHRVRIEIEVTGPERALYQWLYVLHRPAEFRGVTALLIMPKRDDDTQVECRITIEQWFLPDYDPSVIATPAELRPLTEADHYPLDSLLAVTKARPESGLRLDRAEIANQVNAEGTLLRSIRVDGRAQKLSQINTFNLNLKASEALRDYAWTIPPAVEDPRSGQWQFHADAVFAPE